jgi:hypothetical protein
VIYFIKEEKMITNTGKDIVAKYLLGQASAYASHIAIGCGKKPLPSSESLELYQGEFAFKKSLDFEMFRIPIISRGYVTEFDTSNPVTITGVSNPSGSLVIYIAANNFAPGDIVDISGTNIADYNISNAVVYTASSTQFTVQSNASGVYSSGGIAIGRISKVVLIDFHASDWTISSEIIISLILCIFSCRFILINILFFDILLYTVS